MKINEIITEGYDKKHKCLTPGAIYKTEFHRNRIDISVRLPKSKNITIDKKLSEELEVELHYAIEQVLKKLF